jgi:hypothetical protein
MADIPQWHVAGDWFGGQAGGWPADFANLIGEIRGMETASWRAEIPGKASGQVPPRCRSNIRL